MNSIPYIAFQDNQYYDPYYSYIISRNYFDAAVEICLISNLINPATK